MRVLVTRPQPAAERTAAKLQAMGHTAVMLPLMRAEHFAGAVRAALNERHDAIAVTSAEAIRVLGALGTAIEPHLTTPLFAVGEATASAAADLGFTDIRIGSGTGEGLADKIAARMRAGETLIYLAGTPRADGLEQGLRDRQIDYVTVECYRMVPVTYRPDVLSDLVRSGPFDAVLIYSRETARRFVSVFHESGLDATAFASRYLCLSPSAKEALPSSVAVEVAATPGEESLFRLL
ncbi:uroporphyrinogen-III synthase [Ensifer sp. WSM1721]|uniref:uroporphyrinogen-III synthase n=1 Tax=Ensifer sp. WSM1721 TaxID=1041159 RepID=UPI00047BC14D|nr:uroporphyrinogen-III synthase [Ensifer sp. WSM1721]